jgi:predicted glutamine amidotransferase
LCGLCGVARHPSGAKGELAKQIAQTLLLRNQSRGRHATGFAMMQQGQDSDRAVIWKKAVEASKVVPSAPFRSAYDEMSDETIVLIGHTRNATQNNAHEDRAAHPFRMGKVVGAHNGVIYNWREVEKTLREKMKGEQYETFCNDSQAAFAALDHWKDPVRATDELDGWFALTWLRGKYLLMCRTQNIELNAAYVGEMKALFWSSERTVLDDTLKSAGLTGYDLWTLKPNTIYRYDPMEFTAESANGERRDAPFRGIGQGNRNVRVNGADPRRVQSGSHGTPPTGYSTHRTYVGGSRWDGVAGREVFEGTPFASGKSKSDEDQLEMPIGRKKSLGARNAETEMDRVWDYLANVNSEMGRLRAKIETQEAEIAHLYGLFNSELPELFDVRESPYREAPTCEGGPRIANDGTKVCNECGKSGGVLLRVPTPPGQNEEFVHETCVLGDVTTR